MALQIKSKKGGPYPKHEQEKRRKQVYELHFEKGFSAVSIANKIAVNRNTVNEDIRHWQTQIASQFEDLDLTGIIVKQIERLESQKKRLHEQLEAESKSEVKLRIEKMIFEIDYKITEFMSKIVDKIPVRNPVQVTPAEDAEEILREIVLAGRLDNPENTSEESLLQEMVTTAKLGVMGAEEILYELQDMGMEMFPSKEGYNLVSFMTAREIITPKERIGIKQEKDQKK